MSGIVTVVALARATGLSMDMLRHVPAAWATSYLIAFPSVLIVLPLVRRIVALLVAPPA
ncbi:MAG: DUF2798 domain-containing protein [Amaricoccus sp.]|uniref:DUF2798 domain-containing protein n=1 Tax=Amaricoccus sp. TaxID=1872485 RepID=UPI0039E49567